jgi:hypothetical protein
MRRIAQCGRLANRASVWRAAYAHSADEHLDDSMSRLIFSWYVLTYLFVCLFDACWWLYKIWNMLRCYL